MWPRPTLKFHVEGFTASLYDLPFNLLGCSPAPRAFPGRTSVYYSANVSRACVGQVALFTVQYTVALSRAQRV